MKKRFFSFFVLLSLLLLTVPAAAKTFQGAVPSAMNVETLTGTRVLTTSDLEVQALDPGGADRQVTLPAETAGILFYIYNTADADETLTVKEDSGATTIALVPQGGQKAFRSNGTGWYVDEIYIKDADPLPAASAMNGTVAPGSLTVLTSTNSVEGRSFSGTANNDIIYAWRVPMDFVGSVIYVATANWVSNATGPATGEVVAYSVTGASIGASEGLATAQGSAATSSLTVAASPTYVQYDYLETAYVAVTPGGTIAAGEKCIIVLTRLATSTDTYGQDILHDELLIKYGRKLTND